MKDINKVGEPVKFDYHTEYKDFYATGDGIPLFSARHLPWPEKKWYQRILLQIKYFFVRPRFSANAIEPAEKIVGELMTNLLEHDKQMLSKVNDEWNYVVTEKWNKKHGHIEVNFKKHEKEK